MIDRPIVLVACILSLLVGTAELASGETIGFTKQVLTGEYYCDGVHSGDFNQDGHLDVIAGPFWYEGPTMRTVHSIYRPVPIPRAPSPSNSMFSFVHDFNADGFPDVLVLGRVHKHSAFWYENPGSERTDNENKYWTKHFVFERIRGESPAFCDPDGNGKPQIVCHWDGCWGWVEPNKRDPYKPWRFRPIGENEDWPQFYHGTGVGDVNGDGRLDVLINDGWYEQPAPILAQADKRLWKFHRTRFSPQRGGAQMFSHDLDDDGDRDVISSLHAHEWGLAWFEQTTPGEFAMHKIMGDRSEESEYGVAFSQPHALEMADLNSDGRTDIVCGKRRWAHGPDGDVEPMADPVVYWFENVKSADGSTEFIPHLIDKTSGVGTQIHVVDLNADGCPDVLTASKLGTFVFWNRGVE